MSFRNRCEIAGPRGLLSLSIPLVHGRGQRTTFKDVLIDERLPWRSQHWKTLQSCYNRAPWFDHYRTELQTIFDKPARFLLDWNLSCFEWTVKMLGRGLEWSLTEGYRKDYDPNQWIDFRGRIRPGHRSTGTMVLPQKYQQVFGERTGFIPNLSILDLLFCEGKRAVSLLEAEDQMQL